MPYKIQHLGLGGILDQAIAIAKDHFGLLYSINLLLLVPIILVSGAIRLQITPVLPPHPSAQETIAARAALAHYWPLTQGLFWSEMLIFYPLAHASAIQAVARIYLGQPVTAFEAIKLSWNRFSALVGTAVLMWLAVFGWMLLLIVPGLVYLLFYMLSEHVVVIEGLSGRAALRRSKQLVRPHWRTYALLLLVMMPITIGLGMTTKVIPEAHLQLIVRSLITCACSVVATSAGVVFYFSCRCSLENFDLHYLAETIGVAPPTDASELSTATVT